MLVIRDLVISLANASIICWQLPEPESSTNVGRVPKTSDGLTVVGGCISAAEDSAITDVHKLRYNRNSRINEQCK
jgi:hypothetical protein